MFLPGFPFNISCVKLFAFISLLAIICRVVFMLRHANFCLYLLDFLIRVGMGLGSGLKLVDE